MKLSTLGLALLFVVASTKTFAAEKNDCDRLIEAGFPMSSVEKCWEENGKSEYYLQRQAAERREYEENQAEEQRQEAQRQAEARRLAQLQEAIVKKTFSFLELKEKGYGVPFIAVERKYIYKSNGQFKKTEDEVKTSGTNICKLLGFEKATSLDINKKEVDSHKAKGNALYVKKTGGFINSVKYEKMPYTESDPDKTVMYVRSVTCVRSRVANNEVLEAMKEAIRYLEADLNTGAPIVRQNVAVNDSSRFGYEEEEEDEEDGDGSDGSPFTYSANQ